MEDGMFRLMVSGTRSIAPMGRDNAASEDDILNVLRTVYKETTPDRRSMFASSEMSAA